MNLTTFARLAPKFYKSGQCIYLRSGPGRGKTTSIVEAIPRIAASVNKRLGISIVTGPNLTPGDTVGFGIPKHGITSGGKPVDEMVFTLPFFWRTEEGKLLEEYDGGILFIDEADKMDVDIKKVVGEMALSGRCGPHRLPPGWVVWMAGNRVQDRSGSTRELDHLINRRLEIDITDDIASWENWALRHHVHPSIVAFGVSNPQIVFPEKLPEKQGPFCTPRSLVKAGELLVAMAEDGGDLPVDPDAVESVAAGVGAAAAGQLFATLKLEADLPDLKTIVNAPTIARLPMAPDARMLVCYKLASVTDESNVTPVVTYIERLPADFAACYAKALVTRKPGLAPHKAIQDWCKRNSTLMAVVSQYA
jgi:hypothetical protein